MTNGWRADVRSTRLAWPFVAGIGILIGVPVLGAIGLAFTEFSGVRGPRFIALENFTALLGDDAFWRSLGNSVVYLAISMPLRIVAAVGFALLLHRRGPGVGVARGIVYAPTVVPDVAYALLWLWLLNPLYGPVSLAARSGGFDPGFLTDPWSTRIAVAVMAAFQIGEAFVIALAVRRTISPSLYEAAAVDGASPWFAMSRVTLPMMAPAIVLLALRDAVLAFQTSFVPALVVAEGGPRYATTFLPLYVYQAAFRYFRLGYASAMTISMFVLTALVVYSQYRLARRWKLV